MPTLHHGLGRCHHRRPENPTDWSSLRRGSRLTRWCTCTSSRRRLPYGSPRSTGTGPSCSSSRLVQQFGEDMFWGLFPQRRMATLLPRCELNGLWSLFYSGKEGVCQVRGQQGCPQAKPYQDLRLHHQRGGVCPCRGCRQEVQGLGHGQRSIHRALTNIFARSLPGYNGVLIRVH